MASSYEIDGMTFPRVAFADGPNEVTYAPPAGWEYSGSEARFVLRPKNKVHAEASVTASPLSEPMVFDDETMKKLADEALASPPEGSENVQLLSQEKSPIVFDGKETFLVTMSYTYYGENYGRSIMFLCRNGEQLRFQLVSLLDDFNELQHLFLGSHFSWQGL